MSSSAWKYRILQARERNTMVSKIKVEMLHERQATSISMTSQNCGASAWDVRFPWRASSSADILVVLSEARVVRGTCTHEPSTINHKKRKHAVALRPAKKTARTRKKKRNAEVHVKMDKSQPCALINWLHDVCHSGLTMRELSISCMQDKLLPTYEDRRGNLKNNQRDS